MLYRYTISNRHGTVIWDGAAVSAWDAWQLMFEYCKYPLAARNISDELSLGMEINRGPKAG